MTDGLSDEGLTDLFDALRLDTERRPPAHLRSLLHLAVARDRRPSEIVLLAVATAVWIILAPLLVPTAAALVGAMWWLVFVTAVAWVLVDSRV
jgi:hypothetical protein